MSSRISLAFASSMSKMKRIVTRLGELPKESIFT
jgi:hypothetical protein